MPMRGHTGSHPTMRPSGWRQWLKERAAKAGYCSRPTALIIGAQKAGTSALYEVLRQHNSITSASTKEVHFFDRDEWYLTPGSVHTYHSFFPWPFLTPSDGVVFEASPRYLFHPKAGERIYRYDPTVKLIVMLREPAARALSAWTMYHHHFEARIARRHDPRSFREAIEESLAAIDSDDYASDPVSYVKRGLYRQQIDRYLALFPRENLLFLEDRDLRERFEPTVAKICEFLGVRAEALKPTASNTSRVDNKREYDDIIEVLHDFYRPHNIALFEQIGREFNWG